MGAYFRTRPDLALPPEWLAWLGEALAAAPSPARRALPAPLEPRLPVLARHGLLPLLYARLRDDPLWPGLPVAAGVALGDAHAANATRVAVLRRELERIAEAFPWLGLLKGAALGATVYPDPALRPLPDLDLLAEPEDAGAAVERLVALGYRAEDAAARGTFGRVARRFRVRALLAGGPRGIAPVRLVVHWSLTDIPPYVNIIDPAEIWARADTDAFRPYAVPRPAVLLCHAAAQLAAQQCRDLRLIWLVDVDRLARAAGMDWDDLLRLAAAWRLGFALHAALADAGAWLGPAAPKPVAAALGRLAGDRVAQAIWGAGDPAYGAPWRRTMAILPALAPRTALAAAGHVAGRAALRPLERWADARARRGQ